MAPSPFAMPFTYYERLITSQYQYSSQRMYQWLHFNLLYYHDITNCLRAMLTCLSLLPINTSTIATSFANSANAITLTVDSADGIQAGQTVNGPGLAPGTLVTSVDTSIEGINLVYIDPRATGVLLETPVVFTQQAIGAQLDTLGELLGQKRKLNFQPVSGSAILGDDDYRLLLRCTVMRNHWNGQNWSLQTQWQTIFPGGSIIINDGQDMTAHISVAGTFSNMMRELISNDLIVPRPEGVQYNFGVPLLPVFTFDLSNSEHAGFDLGKFS